MDMFGDYGKVNMGTKKDITKEQLVANNRKERTQREIIRKQSDAAMMIQKMLRGYKANQILEDDVFEKSQLKIRNAIIVLRQF